MVTVLKSNSFPAGINTPQAEIFNWEDVANRARDYLASIRAEAQNLLQDCHSECERLREESRREGMRVGEAQVERLAQQMANQIATNQIENASQAIQRICGDLETATQLWLRQWQHETVSLAIGIAEKLLVRQMESDPTILLNWIEDSIRLVQNTRRATLRLHPDDTVLLANILPELLEQTSISMEIEVVEDGSVVSCGVISQTPDTTIDRSLAPQLTRLEQELR